MLRRRALTALLLIATVAVAAAAQPCRDYGDFTRRLGNLPIDGARGVATAGALGYVAGGADGLVVIDLAEPSAPSVVASVPTGDEAIALARRDHRLYVARADARLGVFALDDPTAPGLVGTVALPAAGEHLLVDGDLLLVAAGEAGVLVLDLADPDAPALASAVDTPGTARHVAADGSLIAVADDAGLALITLADPARPRVVSLVGTVGAARGVALDGGRALVASVPVGVEVFDLAIPEAPAPLDPVPVPGGATRVVRHGAVVFAVGRDLSALVDEDEGGLRVVGRASGSATGRDLAIAAGVALVACGDAGLDVIDVEPPDSPPALATATVPGAAFGVAAAGDLTLVGADDLEVFDTADPADPRHLGTLTFAGSTSRVIADGSRAYVSTANEGGARLLVVDVSDPAAPLLLGATALDGFASALASAGDAVYLADFFFGGVFVVDVSTPSQPRVVASVPTDPYAQQLARLGDHLLVGTGAFGDGALQVFDIAAPLDPVPVAELPVPARGINGLAVRSPYVYATLNLEGAGELAIIDASDPAAPSIVSRLWLPDVLHGVVVEAGLAYVTSFLGNVHVVDVGDPAAPWPVGQTFVPDAAFVLALGEQAVAAAATDAGLVLLPRHCATTTGVNAGADGSGRSDGRGAAAAAGVQLRAYPNPFNPRLTLSFRLPREESVTLAVFDLAGRRVATPWSGRLAAGEHAVTWDGRDGRGRALASGRYLVRLEGGNWAKTTKIMRIQ